MPANISSETITIAEHGREFLPRDPDLCVPDQKIDGRHAINLYQKSPRAAVLRAMPRHRAFQREIGPPGTLPPVSNYIAQKARCRPTRQWRLPCRHTPILCVQEHEKINGDHPPPIRRQTEVEPVHPRLSIVAGETVPEFAKLFSWRGVMTTKFSRRKGQKSAAFEPRIAWARGSRRLTHPDDSHRKRHNYGCTEHRRYFP